MRRTLFLYFLFTLLACNTLEAKKKYWGNGLYWELNSSGILTISGNGSMVANKLLTKETPWSKKRIKKVVIENGVEDIGPGVFESCINLLSVEIPNSVKGIGVGAFSYCRSLEAIVIPNSVTGIGDCAFKGCRNLSSVEIPNSVEYIEFSAFENCSKLSSIIIPNSVKHISHNAFSGCSNLSSVVLSESITSIDDYTFEGCRNLTSINIPSSVTSIGRHAFYGCEKLASLKIPKTVKSIGDDAFPVREHWSGNTVTFSGYGKIRDWYKRLGTNDAIHFVYHVQSVIINEGVTSIGDGAFVNCKKLKSVRIPNTVTSIEDSAFSGCENLTSINIPNSVTSIGKYAFSDCSGLTSITIPNSVTSIGESAFSGCSGLTSITIPNSVTSIGMWAFYGCNLKYIYSLPLSVLKGGSYEWYEISLPKELVYSYISKHREEADIRPIYMAAADEIKKNDIMKRGNYSNTEHLKYRGNTYYKVCKNNRYGLTDANGKVIIPVEMEYLGEAGNGYLKFKLNGSWGIMNYAGRTIIPSSRGYTSIGSLSTSQKTFAYTMNGYKGECNAQGRELSRVKVKTDVTNDNINTPQKQEEKKNIIEHHREPQPMQEWVQCHICFGSGVCTIYGCNNGWNSGTRMSCLGCGGSGRCSACAGKGGHYVVVYR